MTVDVDRQYKEIPVERMGAARFQARQQNADSNVGDLATSIEQGLFSPIPVTGSSGGAYELTAGHRRMEAHGAPETTTHVREKRHETAQVTAGTHSRMQNHKEQNPEHPASGLWTRRGAGEEPGVGCP